MSDSGTQPRSATRTRAALLHAAESLFAKQGYQATSLADIGAAAGLSRGTPGYFFGSKELLYREVLDQILKRAGATLAPAYAGLRDQHADVEALVRRVIAAHLDLMISEPALARLIEWESLSGDGDLLRELLSRADGVIESIQALSARVGPRRLGVEEATELLLGAAALCWHPLVHTDSVARALGRDPRSREAIEAQTDYVAEFVFARLGMPQRRAGDGAAVLDALTASS